MAWTKILAILLYHSVSVIGVQHHTHDESFTPDAVLTVTRQNMSIAGVNKFATLVNDSIPGPALHMPENEVFWVRVYNNIEDDNLTMHWHGLTQGAYPFSDGTPQASQWPIPPNHFFDYELQSPNGSAGTYMYHSHVGFQASTAAGPLIILDPLAAPYKTDGERIILLQELFNKTDQEILAGLESTPVHSAGDPNTWLINGKGISDYGITDPVSANLDVTEVEPGLTYRFRCVAATSTSLAMFGFEDHAELDVIAADGGYTMPSRVQQVQIGSGQRYDLLFRAKTCDELRQLGKLDYYIQVERREDTNITSYGLLRYKNSCGPDSQFASRVSTSKNPTQPPVHLPQTIQGYLDYALKPLRNDTGFPPADQVTRRVIINVQQVKKGYQLWTLNNNTWTEDAADPLPHTTSYEPYLVALYKNQTQYLPDYNASLRNGGLDPSTRTYPAKIGEVIEIVFQNLGSVDYNGTSNGSLDVHPWHAHGSHYRDIGGGDGAWSPARAEAQLAGSIPVRRDTTMLYRYNETTDAGAGSGWRAWRLRIDQPGVWMVHYHFLQHMIGGMQTVWVHGDASDILGVGQPDVQGYLTYGGDVYGNSSHAPRVLHFHELE
ncbi:putative laccase [Metarhizium anisopliae]